MAAKKTRTGKIKRVTTETEITVDINLDGTGKYAVSTGIPFFDHMLNLFAKHGLFDLKIKAKGDLEVDFHHTVEDVGIALGEAIKKAVGNKAGIVRYGTADVPMMDSLASVVLDLSDRPYLKYRVRVRKGAVKHAFDPGLVEEFMKALSNSSGMDLHVILHYGRDMHHSVEAVFKSLGRALSIAVMKDPRIKGVMSTKGKL